MGVLYRFVINFGYLYKDLGYAIAKVKKTVFSVWLCAWLYLYLL